MTDARIPAETYPLAYFLYEEFKERGWQTEDCAMRMGYKTDEEFGLDLLSLDFLMAVHEDGLLVGDDLFKKLALALDVSELFFRNVDRRWREAPHETRVAWECPEDIYSERSRAAIPTQQ